MGQPAHLEESRPWFFSPSFAMAPRSLITGQSLRINLPIDPIEQDELAGARSDADSNKALTFPKAPTPPLVSPSSKDLFTKFMKIFMETTQAQVQALAEPWERPLKARTPNTYWGKSHMEYYHIYQ